MSRKKYGDEAFYVHLKRNRRDTAKSFVKRYEKGIIEAYKKIVPVTGRAPIDVCRHYWDKVNSNIDLFLESKSKKMSFQLETAEEDFRKFWDQIGATGNLSSALDEWGREYNASSPVHQPASKTEATPLPARLIGKIRRVVRKLPAFLQDA